MEQTKIPAKYCRETKYENLPLDVVKITKQTILDTLGCAIGTHSDEPDKAGRRAFLRGLRGAKGFARKDGCRRLSHSI